ncbi:MAG: hypothetical protein JXQ23_01210 [Clostridia bacterium]|nr:hypothetical protein [Clostridia bacterium]
MMKKMLLMILIIILLFSCGCRQKSDVISSEWWNDIVDKEFTNYDIWAGSGLLFYEEDGKPYCDYMVYGSGLPVIFTCTSSVILHTSGTVTIELPENIIIGTISEETPSENMKEVPLIIESDTVILESLAYRVTDESY